MDGTGASGSHHKYLKPLILKSCQLRLNYDGHRDYSQK
jgi:hypothetical protein